MKPCLRCGKPFDPEAVKRELKGFGRGPGFEPRFCVTCMVRNMTDALDLPTPPRLLDKFSKHPTLSDREFDRKIKEEKEEQE